VSQRNLTLSQQLQSTEEELRTVSAELSRLSQVKDAMARVTALNNELAEVHGLLTAVTQEKDKFIGENAQLQLLITRLEHDIEYLKSSHEKSLQLAKEMAQESDIRFMELRQQIKKEKEEWETERLHLLSRDRESAAMVQSLRADVQQLADAKQKAEAHVQEVEAEMRVLLVEVRFYSVVLMYDRM